MADIGPMEPEQLDGSLAMVPVLGERDRQTVIDAVRRLAVGERAKVRHPSLGR